MSAITALVLAVLFAAIVGTVLMLAPSEDQMTPIIDQVSQHVEQSTVAR